MEQGSLQKFLTHGKGLCNVPSDATCDDDQLEVCTNMMIRDGELVPIQHNAELFGLGDDEAKTPVINGELMFVHELDNEVKHYIYWVPEEEGKQNTLYYYTEDETGVKETEQIDTDFYNVLSVRAIGNTLILNTKEGIYYFLWSTADNSYKFLQELPILDVEYKNGADITVNPEQFFSGIIVSESGGLVIGGTSQDAYNELMVGLYSKAKNLVKNKKAFSSPYFVRVALELYDGSYYHISNPVLMLPYFEKASVYGIHDFVGNEGWLTVEYYGKKLSIKINNTDLQDWKDLVRNIVVFVSREQEEFVTTGDIPLTSLDKTYTYYATEGRTLRKKEITTSRAGNSFASFERKTVNTKIKELKKESIFYKLCEIPLSDTEQWLDTSEYFEDTTLENLATADTIQKDDYYSFCKISANGIDTFNRRLNIYGVNRGFYNGFKTFNAIDSDEVNFCIVVYIKSSNVSERIVRNEFTSKELISHYFYYPDTRAYKAEIYVRTDGKWELNKTMQLEQHQGLNGSIYLDGFPSSSDTNTPESGSKEVDVLPTTITDFEYLHGFLLQSEVDNPFALFASSYTKVGQGSIKGIAGLTTALSQDAYLVSTTLVFTTQGIWALKIDDEGQYSSVAPPFSREVCNNPDSITMVDHAVYFTSEKGLMITDGNDVQCVSDQMYNDAEFHEFLAGSQIAFDYRDRLLWITNEEYDYHYIYNMASQTFAKLIDENKYTAIVGDYPDVLMQDSTKVVHSLINKPFAGKDTITYSGEVQTRPMKFDEVFALKNVSQIEPVSLIKTKRGVEKGAKITMYASNNLRDWYEITSVKGAPFKYFKLKYTFTNLNADDVYSGTEVVFATRRTNKLR